jgi:murein DD-endopeptidase MepM/ murein hydrolase activator NlpD
VKRLLLLLVLLPVLLAGPAGAAPRPGFRWPLAGTPVVERGFDPPTSAYGAGHRGVDLRAAAGEPVLAAGPGRVTYAGLLAGRGVVTVTHDGGLRTTYEPVTATVRVGQAVAAGAVLGRLAAGHASCRPGVPCLHWGLLRGATYLDPLSLLSAGPVRLLPLGPAAAPVALPVARGAAQRKGNGPARAAGAATAAGALLLGIRLLRPGPAAPPGHLGPPPPVDLGGERRRRRAA